MVASNDIVTLLSGDICIANRREDDWLVSLREGRGSTTRIILSKQKKQLAAHVEGQWEYHANLFGPTLPSTIILFHATIHGVDLLSPAKLSFDNKHSCVPCILLPSCSC